jgi:hypothetical protein
MEQVDFSAFGAHDVADIALQRTKHLKRWPLLGCISYKAWVRGNHRPLQMEAVRRRDSILHGAMADIEAEFRGVTDYLAERPIRRMVDIGCGHALIDLLFWRKYGCHVHLVDIERTDATHHDYRNTGAGYASLESARKFLTVNGVPADAITTTNPQRETLHDSDVDLILSMISAGFHYPISTYTDFALNSLRSGGVLMFDARDGTGQETQLSGFDRVDVVGVGQKSKKLAATKP